MLVKDAMSKNPVCCTATTPLQKVAAEMVQCNCGEIPVEDDAGKVIGVITDRDIVCRALALGKNPLELSARDCMSTKVVTIGQDATVDDAVKVMENAAVRRLPVVDQQGKCIGIITQADIARVTPAAELGELVQRITEAPAPSVAS